LLLRHIGHSEELLSQLLESSGSLLYSSVLTGDYLPMFGSNVAISLGLNITEVGGNIVPPKCRWLFPTWYKGNIHPHHCQSFTAKV